MGQFGSNSELGVSKERPKMAQTLPCSRGRLVRVGRFYTQPLPQDGSGLSRGISLPRNRGISSSGAQGWEEGRAMLEAKCCHGAPGPALARGGRDSPTGMAPAPPPRSRYPAPTGPRALSSPDAFLLNVGGNRPFPVCLSTWGS